MSANRMAAETSDQSYSLGKALLPPCLEYRDRNGVGKVETALSGQHGQAQAEGFGEFRHQCSGQPAGFLTKNEDIIGVKRHRVIASFALGRDGKETSSGQRHLAGLPILVPDDAHEFVVIQARALEFAIFPGKAERLDQMEFRTGVGA